MRFITTTGATNAPTTILLQTTAVRRRVAASDAVAALVAGFAFGEPRRSDLAALASVTASRCGSSAGAR